MKNRTLLLLLPVLVMPVLVHLTLIGGRVPIETAKDENARTPLSGLGGGSALLEARQLPGRRASTGSVVQRTPVAPYAAWRRTVPGFRTEAAEASIPPGSDGQDPPGRTGAADRDRQAIIRLLQDWGDAYVRRDWATLDRVRSDDWTYAGDSSGALLTKAQADALFKQDPTEYLAFEFTDVQVRVYGRAAAVTSLEHIQTRSAGVVSTMVLRLSVFLVKGAKGWRAFSSHSTIVDEKPARSNASTPWQRGGHRANAIQRRPR